MIKHSKYSTFIDSNANAFHLFLEKEKEILKKVDPEYNKILSDIGKIRRKNPKIESIFVDEIVVLSKDDCKDLLKVIDLQYRQLRKEEKAIFLKGEREIIQQLKEFDKLEEQGKNLANQLW